MLFILFVQWFLQQVGLFILQLGMFLYFQIRFCLQDVIIYGFMNRLVVFDMYKVCILGLIRGVYFIYLFWFSCQGVYCLIIVLYQRWQGKSKFCFCFLFIFTIGWLFLEWFVVRLNLCRGVLESIVFFFWLFLFLLRISRLKL